MTRVGEMQQLPKRRPEKEQKFDVENQNSPLGHVQDRNAYQTSMLKCQKFHWVHYLWNSKAGKANV